MRNENGVTEAHQRYALAYATHYTERDLPSAMWLYKQVMTSYPDDPESEYAREQIQNIVNATVPKQDLLDAQMHLALVHFEHSV